MLTCLSSSLGVLILFKSLHLGFLIWFVLLLVSLNFFHVYWPFVLLSFFLVKFRIHVLFFLVINLTIHIVIWCFVAFIKYAFLSSQVYQSFPLGPPLLFLLTKFLPWMLLPTSSLVLQVLIYFCLNKLFKKKVPPILGSGFQIFFFSSFMVLIITWDFILTV